jgi:hypothetical protein
MTFYGRIQNGRVVLDEPVNLPDGTKVTVFPLNDPSTTEEPTAPTMYERWKPLIGAAKHLPPDASTKIDEVLYGRTGE